MTNGLRSTVVTACSLLALSGCAAASIATPLRAAPEPAVSPPADPHPAGMVLPLAGTPEGVVVDRDGTVAVSVRRPDALVIFDLTHPAERRTVPLTGAARHLSLAGPDGPVLVPQESDDRLAEVALPAGPVIASIPVGRQPHDATAVGPATVFASDELADTITVIEDGRVARAVPAPVQPGGIAASPDSSIVVALGVRGRRITAYRPDGSPIETANCGAGPTHAVTGSDGLFWVVDTNAGAILGFRVDSRGPHQVARIPVGNRPYGVAYDHARSTLWVTLTATNQVLGLRLSGARVTARIRYATVRQPNSVAVSDTTGDLVVTGSTTPGEIQLISANG